MEPVFIRPTFMEHAMNLAEAASRRSEDPFCRVGACVLDNAGVVRGVGYNGTLPGITIDWSDRDGRRGLVLHAEANALRHVTPRDVDGGILAVTHWPCSDCTLLAASYGIRRIAWRLEPDWQRYPPTPTNRVAKVADIELVRIW